MAKHYENIKNNPILFHMNKAGLMKSDLQRHLNCTYMTLNSYIVKPHLLTLEKVCTLSGLFGLSLEEFVYLLSRNKPQMNDAGKWYIEDIRKKHLGDDV